MSVAACERLIALNGGNPSDPIKPDAILQLGREQSVVEARATSLGYFTLCQTCKQTLCVPPGDPLVLPQGLCALNPPAQSL